MTILAHRLSWRTPVTGWYKNKLRFGFRQARIAKLRWISVAPFPFTGSPRELHSRLSRIPLSCHERWRETLALPDVKLYSNTCSMAKTCSIHSQSNRKPNPFSLVRFLRALDNRRRITTARDLDVVLTKQIPLYLSQQYVSASWFTPAIKHSTVFSNQIHWCC